MKNWYNNLSILNWVADWPDFLAQLKRCSPAENTEKLAKKELSTLFEKKWNNKFLEKANKFKTLARTSGYNNNYLKKQLIQVIPLEL